MILVLLRTGKVLLAGGPQPLIGPFRVSYIPPMIQVDLVGDPGEVLNTLIELFLQQFLGQVHVHRRRHFLPGRHVLLQVFISPAF